MALMHYYQGSMYAGKSTHAVNALLQATDYDQRIMVSPSWHTRGYLSRNHHNTQIPANITILANLSELETADLTPNLHTLLVVDEIQFCPIQPLQRLLEMAKDSLSLDLIVAGLQVGQHGQPFTNDTLLKAYFKENITLLHAPCALCESKEGLVAIRKWLIDDYICDEYSLLCKHCFDKFFAYGRSTLAIPDPLFHKIN